MRSPRIPSRNWSGMPFSCWAKSQPGFDAADIELCVAGTATSSYERSQSASDPLQPVVSIASDRSEIPPTPMKIAPAARIAPAAIPAATSADRPRRWSRSASSGTAIVSRMSSATPAYATKTPTSVASSERNSSLRTMIRMPATTSRTARTARQPRLSGTRVASSHACATWARRSTGRSSEDAAAAITPPQTARRSSVVPRSPRNASQIPDTASRPAWSSIPVSTSASAARSPTLARTARSVIATPTTSTASRPSPASRIAPYAQPIAMIRARIGSQRMASASRTRSATGAGRSPSTSSTLFDAGICLASFGWKAWSTPRTVAPMSTSVRVRVSWSPSKTERCMSATPTRKRLWKAPPLMRLEVTLSITGRTATRFGSASTSSSATRIAASSATA